MEPDPRLVELWLERKGLDGAKVVGVSTPGEKSGTYHDKTKLKSSKVTLHTSCVMRLVNLSAETGNLAFIGTKDFGQKGMKRIMVKLGHREKSKRHSKALFFDR